MFDSDICKKKDGSPLKTYESEYEAQEAIEYVKRQYGKTKQAYPTYEVAKRRAEIIFDEKGI